MPNPEQVPPQTFADSVLQLQSAKESLGVKLMSDAYGAAPVSDTLAKGPPPKMKTENNASTGLEKEGNVESLKLPNGFSKGSSDKSENFHQFNSGANKDTKVCYWKRQDFSADDEDTQLIDDVLKKPAHTLSEQETLDVMPMMAPGRPWGTGNYKDLALSTQDIDGRRVLVADFKMNDLDKRVHLIIANQDSGKHQIENIWVEGPSKDFDSNNKAVLDSFKQIKWSDKK